MLQIGDKITIKKVQYSVYDLEDNYICLKCAHAYLVNRKCANCGAEKRTQGFTNGDIDKEYKDTTVGRISKLIN